MFEAISELLAGLGSRTAPARLVADDERLALAALLVHVATVDGRFLDSEAQALETLLADRFALGRPAARRLITKAQTADVEALDFTEFATRLKRRLGPQERARVIELMWSIARADGQVHESEEALIGRVAQLLEVG